jgi:hypothetical protein
MLPSDFFHRNVVLSFQEDAIGIRLFHHYEANNHVLILDRDHKN